MAATDAMAKYSWLADFMRQPPVWEPFSAAPEQVAIAARARLARNVAGFPFPAKAEAAVRERLADDAFGMLCRLRLPGADLQLRLRHVEPSVRSVLIERRLISPRFGQGGAGQAVAIGRTHHVSVLVNEEDHLRIQALVPGSDVARAFALASGVAAALETQCRFAFDPELGYLTACPSNVGTGLRVSVLLHLPGVALVGLIPAIGNALEALGCTIRGAFGEGTEPLADLYQVSNQSTLGETEGDICRRLSRFVGEIVSHEQTARRRLAWGERTRLHDHIGRAYGIVRHAHLLTEQQALDGISALVLGVRLGLLRTPSMASLNRLFLEVQPGHLQAAEGRLLAEAEQPVVRADRCRRVMRGA